MNGGVPTRILKRLTAAEGYLELGMPDHALQELTVIDEPGHHEASVQYLKGEALISQERYEEAIEPLQRAVELVPSPHNQRVLFSLSECFRQSGEEELADEMQKEAEAATAEVIDTAFNDQPYLKITHRFHRKSPNPEKPDTDG